MSTFTLFAPAAWLCRCHSVSYTQKTTKIAGDTETHLKTNEVAVNANSLIDHLCSLNIDKAPRFRQSSIICAIGPKSWHPHVLDELIRCGMNIACICAEDCSKDFILDVITKIREASKRYQQGTGIQSNIAIALETRGPSIHTGMLRGGAKEVQIKKGEIVRLTTERSFEFRCSEIDLYVDYPTLTTSIKVGDKIFIDGGEIILIVGRIDNVFTNCTVEKGGMLGSKRKVNFPGILIDLPPVTEKDEEDLMWASKQDIDIIFASFIQSAKAIHQVRYALGIEGRKTRVIAKIENYQGLNHLDEILEAADGIVIARGALSIEIPPEKVFLAQKALIARCLKWGKPCIVASEIFPSMTKQPIPTRLESSDIANAIIDGADCVMLSDETALGDNPADCVRVLHSLMRDAEAAIWHKQFFMELSAEVIEPLESTHSIAMAAVDTAFKVAAAAIVVITTSGESAFIVARFRPYCPVIAVSRRIQVVNQSHLHRGIMPFFYDQKLVENWSIDVDSRVALALDYALKRSIVKEDDPIVVVTGWNYGSGFTNTVRVMYVPKRRKESVNMKK